MTSWMCGEDHKNNTTSSISSEENNAIRSYAYVEHIGDGAARLELRLTSINFVPPDEGNTKRRYRHPRKNIEISAEDLFRSLPDVKQMDVIVVEHIEGDIQSFCYIDHEETQRRCERARARREELERKMRSN